MISMVNNIVSQLRITDGCVLEQGTFTVLHTLVGLEWRINGYYSVLDIPVAL